MNKFSTLAIIAIAAISMASCGSSKHNLSYFDNIADSLAGTLITAPQQIRIVPDDELSITVSSLNPAATEAYNLSTSYTAVPDHNTGVIIYQHTGSNRTYQVSPQGDISFPVLGTLHVAGMTTDEVAEMLYKRISETVDNPIINVRLTNFHVNIIGEVNRPGVVSATGETFTILDAIARAGDLPKYAVRDNILLIRDNNGKKEYHRLNLKDSKTFESPYFYLRQNDIIVVDPNSIAESNATYNTNNAYKIQVTSAIISACSVIASLVIALAVKRN